MYYSVQNIVHNYNGRKVCPSLGTIKIEKFQNKQKFKVSIRKFYHNSYVFFFFDSLCIDAF